MVTAIGRRLLVFVLALALLLVGLQVAIMASSSGAVLFIMVVAALLIAFAAMAQLNVLQTTAPIRKRMARRVLVTSFAPPLVLAIPQGMGALDQYARAFMIGSIAWIAIALMFSLLVLRRIERQSVGGF